MIILILIDLRRVRKFTIIILSIMVFAAFLLAVYSILDIQTGLTVDDIQYKDYTGLDGRISYKLPSGWKTDEKKFEGGEILYHNDFTSEDKIIHGYVEVWDLNIPLIQFIKEGKKSGIGIASYKYYTVEDVKINGKEGYILHYSRAGDSNKYINAFEVFVLDKGNTFYRFAFYMDENKWKDKYRMFFLDIAATARMM